MGIKVIFLDIDGVLNNLSTKEKTPDYHRGISTPLAAIFRRIIEETDAKIVLSSTWRLFPEMHDYMWKSIGLDIKERCIGETPSVWSGDRGEEIERWLQSNKNLEIDRFVIIDDTDEMWPHMDKLIQTNEMYGLTNENADAIIKTLNN